MNRPFSLPRLAGGARKFQVGDTDLKSTHVTPSENGNFLFQLNPAGGEDLLNKKHSRFQRVSVQTEKALSQMLIRC
jgi:hypothetical protein